MSTVLRTSLASDMGITQVSSGDPVKIGTGVNHTEIEADGTFRLRGNATAWRDMVTDISGRRLSSTSGKVDYEYEENAIKFQSGGSISVTNDRVQGNQEINHEFKVGSAITFKPHIHWFQKDTTAFVFTARWRVIRNGYSFDSTDPWTETTTTCGTDISSGGNDVWTFALAVGDDTFGQITTFPDIVTDCGISDTIQFQMARTDSLSGDVLVYFMDTHGEVDSIGSDEVISKET